jgi:hypothetical protein
MTREERELLVARISAGTYIYKDYIIVSPTCQHKYRAQLIYQRALRDATLDSPVDLADLNFWLNHWSKKDDESLKKIDEEVENIKVNMYENYLNDDKVKFLRKNLKMLNERHDRMLELKYHYDDMTAHGYALSAKTIYLIAVSIRDINGNPIWNDLTYKDANKDLIDDIIQDLTENAISIAQYRELSRTDPWRSIWTANQTNIFGVSAIDMTEEQRTLILFSKMYDSVYENSDRPPDNIIEDDDLLDGWFIFQRRLREKDANQKQLDKILGGKAGQSQEVFLPAGSIEHAKKIGQLNDAQADLIKKQRFAVIEQNKEAKEKDLPDRKREIFNNAIGKR